VVNVNLAAIHLLDNPASVVNEIFSDGIVPRHDSIFVSVTSRSLSGGVTILLIPAGSVFRPLVRVGIIVRAHLLSAMLFVLFVPRFFDFFSALLAMGETAIYRRGLFVESI
jgi:hypothetical protein